VKLSLNAFLRMAVLALLISAGLQACSQQGGDAGTEGSVQSDTSDTSAARSEAANMDEQADVNLINREGVVVEFAARPARSGGDNLIAADWADVSFRITDQSTGEPITGRYPAAWMDLSKAWEAKGDKTMTCDERVRTYLQGIVGVRPMIDLNAHFLLVLNADSSISVIDPAVGITGITNLFAQINLDRPGADWAKTENQKRIFVSMPLANSVALVDTEAFTVIGEVPAGENPTRVELQGDERYLWVGNNSGDAETSGVTVIDAVDFKQVTFIPTGKGHHEITFSADDRYAFVSNRNDGTVTVIDVQTLKKVKDLETGEIPISVAFSPLSNAVYVADGKTGMITVVDASSHEVRGQIEARPGLGPMRFSRDGRWGIVVNPFEDTVFVIDASRDQMAHTIKVGKQPYQVTFTRSFGYIRSLGTEQVGLIPLSELDETGKLQVSYIAAGQNPPGAAAQLSISDSIVPSVKEAAAYIVNQAEGTVHYYMEGMGAPMGAFRNYGHQARAIETVDRSLSEKRPGVYTGQVKIPVEGTYDVAFMMDTPRFLHCFSAKVHPNPEIEATTAKLALDFQVADKRVPVGGSTNVKFKLTDPRSGAPVSDVSDMTVMYYRADGRGRTVAPAKAQADGSYEAQVKIDTVATYYVFIGSKSQAIKYTDLPFLTLMGAPAAEPEDEAAARAGDG
jgi:YVTN family beta-propeller protein